MAVKSHTGQGGKSFQDRELAARVRTLGLNEIEFILIANGHSPEARKARAKLKVPKGAKNAKLYQATVARLSGTLLPRINEHSGPDGGPIDIKGVKITVRK